MQSQPADPAAPPSSPPVTNGARWTPARQRRFLAALLDGGNTAAAARAAGMSRSSAYRLRARLAGTPVARTWDAALAEHARRLADPFARPSAPVEPEPRG